MKQVLTALAATADGAMVRDVDGKVVLWNRAAERMLGYRAADVIGRPCHEVLRGETLAGHPFCSPSCTIGKRLACGNAVRNFDIQTHTKSGRVIWLNVSSLPVPSRKKGRFLAAHLFRDITRLAKVRQLEEELHAALVGAAASPPEIQTDPLSRDQQPEVPAALPLSGREREVFRLLASGVDTRTIADRLCISPATVRNHIQHILEKLGAHSCLQALAIAFHPGQPPS
jgi:PAS domain S-box-containing protein